MREIKFRRMPEDRDGFRYGDLFISCDGTCFIQYDWQEYGIGETNEVYSKTIGQYTGLKDKNGKEIYEGDILNSLNSTRIVVFNEDTCSFMLKDIKLRNELFSLNKEKCADLEIIGNIHENPELLEE